MRRATGPAGAAMALLTTIAAADTTTSCVDGAAIPDGGTLERTVAVAPSPTPRLITGVRVRLEGTHPWVGDLRATLVHPSGLAVTLIDRPGIPSTGFPGPWGCGGDDFACTLSDDAATAVESTCSFGPPPVLAGTLRPNGPLQAFAGLPPHGAWRIVVEDAVIGDAGALARACLELDTAPDCGSVPGGCGCTGDIDRDLDIDAADLAAILSGWGPCPNCPADLDGDGAVGSTDLTRLLAAWGPCPSG